MGTCCNIQCGFKDELDNIKPCIGENVTYYPNHPGKECCACNLTDKKCKNKNWGAKPHLNSRRCECECDLSRIPKAKPVDTDLFQCLGLEPPINICPPDKPYFSTESCGCECTVDPNSCNEYLEWNSSFCACLCPLKLKECLTKQNPCDDPSKPDFDTEKCKCICELDPAEGGPGCTDSSKPHFRPEYCDCSCQLGITLTCPTDMPYVDKSKCECYCPEEKISALCDKNKGLFYDPETCSCAPCKIIECDEDEEFDVFECKCVYTASSLSLDMVP